MPFSIFFRPTISRVYFVLCLLLSLLISLHVVDVFHVIFQKERILENGEYWRLVTSLFCFGDLNVFSIFRTFISLQNLFWIENHLYGHCPADFLLFVLIGWVVLWIVSYYHPRDVLGHGFGDYTTYYFSKRFPDLRIHWVPFIYPRAQWYSVVLGLIAIQGWETFMTVGVPALTAHAYFVLKDVLFVKYSLRLFTRQRAPTRLSAS
jgi:hypothetical protein